MRVAFGLLTLLMLAPRAYVDPTAGGVLMQLILGGSLLSVVWRVVRARFSRPRKPPAETVD